MTEEIKGIKPQGRALDPSMNSLRSYLSEAEPRGINPFDIPSLGRNVCGFIF